MSPSHLNKLCQHDVLGQDSFDRTARKLYQEHKIHYQRIPGHLLLEIDPLQMENITTLHREWEHESGCKILCLDRVSDVQNAASILRTAAFYSVPFLIIARKGGFGITPAFYRLASGATEYVRIIPVNNLSRTLSKLKDKRAPIIGLSEKGVPWDTPCLADASFPPCLVLGAEGEGLSHAVERCVDKLVQIPSQGPLTTLNVSVASALAMEKFLGTKRA